MITIEQRKIDQHQVEKLKEEIIYSYSSKADTSDSPFSKVFDYLINLILDFFKASTETGSIQQIIVIAVFGGISVYAFLKIFGLGENFGLYNNKKSNGNYFDQGFIENINEIDFPTLINEAYLNKDYRGVVRNYYLFTLNRLDHKGIIKWKKGKTNIEYLIEVSDPNLKRDFSSLNHYFEYAIYGEFEVSENLAKSSEDLFNEINKSIE